MKWIIASIVSGVSLAAAGRAQVTQRVSVGVGSLQGDLDSVSGSTNVSSLSADGRVVAFASFARNLVPGDTNAIPDLFVRDLVLGSTTRVSVSSSGAQANQSAGQASLSSDGRYVAFASSATNLVAGDTNANMDVFLHDRQTGSTTVQSVGSNGMQVLWGGSDPSLSADGRYLAFQSYAPLLVPGDMNFKADIFVRDLQAGTTTLVSLDSFGAQANGHSRTPRVSGDGRYIAFLSDATNLVPGDTNGQPDVFVRDTQLGITTRVSVDSLGAQGDFYSEYPSISVDGRFVAFESASSNLVPSDTNGLVDIFVHDQQTGQTTRASVGAGGAQSNGRSSSCSVCGDGSSVVFTSEASNLVAGDTNGLDDVFVRDLVSGTTTRVSVDTAGAQGNTWSDYGVITQDGRRVVFTSFASNLVPGDTNGDSDVFMRDFDAVDPFIAFCFGDGSLATPCPCAPPDSVPNPSGATGYGCANSFAPTGARLFGEGHPQPDTILFTASLGTNYQGFGFLVKGNAHDANGVANGDGLRCVSGSFVRFGSHLAGVNGELAGYWRYPNSAQTIAVSLATGQSAGETAWYQLYYRNSAAGFCSPATTNWTNGVTFAWP